MSDEKPAMRVNQAKADYAARRDAFRQAAARGRDASPQAVEATLAGISEEVTAEAIERRRNKDKPR